MDLRYRLAFDLGLSYRENSPLAFVFSFWPVKLTIEALFLTTVFYVLTGASQQYLLGKLFKKSITEFLTVFLAVFLLLLLTTAWR